ncbi:MAG: ATP-binding cassette domain-containing protein [Halanaerobiales bacterium]
MIIFNNVSKDNVEKLSLYIDAGEMVCINDNDREKLRTVFKLLNGTEKVEDGIIRYFDKGSYSNIPAKNLMGFVFNEDILIPERTIKENIKYIMRIKELDMSCLEIRLKRIAEIVDIKNEINKKPGELLTHQLMRANIAQAIINYPPVLVLEDPLIGLDEINSQGIIHLLKRLNKFSMTIVLLNSKKDLVLGNEVRIVSMNDTQSDRRKDYYA